MPVRVKALQPFNEVHSGQCWVGNPDSKTEAGKFPHVPEGLVELLVDQGLAEEAPQKLVDAKNEVQSGTAPAEGVVPPKPISRMNKGELMTELGKRSLVAPDDMSNKDLVKLITDFDEKNVTNTTDRVSTTDAAANRVKAGEPGAEQVLAIGERKGVVDGTGAVGGGAIDGAPIDASGAEDADLAPGSGTGA